MFRACSMYCLCVNVYCHRVTAQLQLINISYHYPAHLQEVYVVIVYMQPLASSLSAGDCLVHRLRKNFPLVLSLSAGDCLVHRLRKNFPLVLSLSAGDCLVHRLRKNFLNRCTRQSPAESDDTRGCIYTITT